MLLAAVRAVSFRKIAAMDASKLAMELLGGSGAINKVLSLLAFTSPKVQILTQNEQHDKAGRVAAQEAALILLALLVQTYTY
jgi:hypothetical protein